MLVSSFVEYNNNSVVYTGILGINLVHAQYCVLFKRILQ